MVTPDLSCVTDPVWWATLRLAPEWFQPLQHFYHFLLQQSAHTEPGHIAQLVYGNAGEIFSGIIGQWRQPEWASTVASDEDIGVGMVSEVLLTGMEVGANGTAGLGRRVIAPLNTYPPFCLHCKAGAGVLTRCMSALCR